MKGLISECVRYKSQNPRLKCIVAVGGYNPDLVLPWYQMAESSAARLNFANNLLNFIRNTGLDGVG